MASLCVAGGVLVAIMSVATIALNLSPAGMVGEVEYEEVEGETLLQVWEEMDSIDIDVSRVETPEEIVTARRDLRAVIAARVLSSRGRSEKTDPWYEEDIRRFAAGGTL